MGGGAGDLHHLVQLVNCVIGGDAAAIDVADDVAHLVIEIEVTDICRSRIGTGVSNSCTGRIAVGLLEIAAGRGIARRVIDVTVAVRVAFRKILVAIDIPLRVRLRGHLPEIVVGVQGHDRLHCRALDDRLVGAGEQMDSRLLGSD